MATINLPQVKEYQTKAGPKFLGWFYFTGLGGIAIACAVGIVYGMIEKAYGSMILTVPGFLLTGVGAWGIVNDITGTLTLESDQFIYTNLTKSIAIPFIAVKGYSFYSQGTRRRTNVISIHEKDSDKVIRINENYNDASALKSWLTNHFRDVTIERFQT